MERLLLAISLASGAVLVAVLNAIATIDPNPIGQAVACAGGLAYWAIAFYVVAAEARRRLMHRKYDRLCIQMALQELMPIEGFWRRTRREMTLEELLGVDARKAEP